MLTIASPLLAPAHAALDRLPVYAGEMHTDLDVGDLDMAIERLLTSQRIYGAHHRAEYRAALRAVVALWTEKDAEEGESVDQAAPTPRTTGDVSAT